MGARKNKAQKRNPQPAFAVKIWKPAFSTANCFTFGSSFRIVYAEEGVFPLKSKSLRDVRRLLIITVAAVVSAFNIRTFVNSAGLFPGGFSGLTILLQSVFEKYLGVGLPFSLVNLLLNAVPAAISFRCIGRKFTLLSCLYLVLSSVLVDVIPGMTLTNNSLLLSVFGGIVGGFAISLCLNADATSGGTDFISISLSERYGIDAFNYVLAGNVAMFGVAGLLFGWERALYSIIYQFVCTQVIHALFTRYQKQTLFIVTEHPQQVYEVIREATHHAATLFRGEGLFQQEERFMVYSVVARSEVRALVKRVREADEHAFINSIRTQSLTGRFYQRPND